jgi:methionyl-tRNA formyltransferase
LEIGNNVFKIRSTDLDPTNFYPKTPGTLLKLSGPNAAIISGDGKLLLLKEIQAPGKPFMPIADFLRGHELPWGVISPSHSMKALERTSFPF